MQTDQIYADLHERLVSNGFAPGERLKPTDLQDEYACSANRIREVLLRLSAVGLVDSEMQRGFRVPKASLAIRTDITRFRILIETEGALQALRRGGTAWEAQLAASHHRLSHIETRLIRSRPDGPDIQLWNRGDHEFHMSLIAACGSPLLLETYAELYARFRQQNAVLKRDFGGDYFRAIVEEHRLITDAALARDETALTEAIYKHLERNISEEDA